MLRDQADWFHYSVDFRIGTRYMGEHIVDNFKREAMRNPFLRALLRSDSIYIASNITFENLAPLSTYLGKPGDPAKGGIPFDDYLRRQRAAPRRRDRGDARRADLRRQGRGDLRLPPFRLRHLRLALRGGRPARPGRPGAARPRRHTLLVSIRGTEADFEALAGRFDKAPKPMYYPEDFLTELWTGYLAAERPRARARSIPTPSSATASAR